MTILTMWFSYIYILTDKMSDKKKIQTLESKSLNYRNKIIQAEEKKLFFVISSKETLANYV